MDGDAESIRETFDASALDDEVSDFDTDHQSDGAEGFDGIYDHQSEVCESGGIEAAEPGCDGREEGFYELYAEE